MRLLFKTILIILLLSIVIYVSVLALALAARSNFTYIPSQAFLPCPFPDKEDLSINMVGTKTETLHAWYIPADPVKQEALERPKTILFAHGNGGNVSFYSSIVTVFRSLGCNTLVFDYPGFGNSTGEPSEQGCYEAGNLFFKFLVEGPKQVPVQDIVVVGMSLGGAIAARLAATHECHSLVLLSTFVSPRELVCSLFRPLWLWSYLANEFFLNDDLKKLALKNPVFAAKRSLVLHSKQDKLIAFAQAETNAATLSCGAPVEIVGWHGDPFFPESALAALRRLWSESNE